MEPIECSVRLYGCREQRSVRYREEEVPSFSGIHFLSVRVYTLAVNEPEHTEEDMGELQRLWVVC